jgi:hypothetical protein
MQNLSLLNSLIKTTHHSIHLFRRRRIQMPFVLLFFLFLKLEMADFNLCDFDEHGAVSL